MVLLLKLYRGPSSQEGKKTIAYFGCTVGWGGLLITTRPRQGPPPPPHIPKMEKMRNDFSPFLGVEGKLK